MDKIIMRIACWYANYCDFFKIEMPFLDTLCISVMPFNTLLKTGERVREDEALSMKLARSLGLPVPRVLFYAESFEERGAIWMTRVPGVLLSQVWRQLSDAERFTIMGELHHYLLRLRECKNPRSPEVSSITGGSIKSFRTCNGGHRVRDQSDAQRVEFDDQTRKIEHLADMEHSIVFTHGDLMRHNILVKDGHITGIIDWECAGWLPEYWDYTTMTIRGYNFPSSWNSAIHDNPTFKYYEELICDHALFASTNASFPR
ncbi:hypothetical protein C0995_014328 [Termitomyces sp. Mi166|nr:hypothetical protein C0995_014328 [Termitomyces sp. Mi166\